MIQAAQPATSSPEIALSTGKRGDCQALRPLMSQINWRITPQSLHGQIFQHFPQTGIETILKNEVPGLRPEIGSLAQSLALARSASKRDYCGALTPRKLAIFSLQARPPSFAGQAVSSKRTNQTNLSIFLSFPPVSISCGGLQRNYPAIERISSQETGKPAALARSALLSASERL